MIHWIGRLLRRRDPRPSRAGSSGVPNTAAVDTRFAARWGDEKTPPAALRSSERGLGPRASPKHSRAYVAAGRDASFLTRRYSRASPAG